MKPHLLVDDSETSRMIAALDWSQHCLGAIDKWSPALCTTLDIVLRSKVAMVMMWGEQHTLLYNDAYARFAGIRHPSILGMATQDAWPEVWEWNKRVLEIAFSGLSQTYERVKLTLKRSDAPEDVWLDLYYTPVSDELGRIIGVHATAIDVTERCKAEQALRELNETLERRVADEIASRMKVEQALRHAQKLEAVGQLTGGVAHDFNNVLQIISGNLQLVRLNPAHDEATKKRLDAALEAVKRGAKLSSHLLAFARRQPLQPVSTNLMQLLRNMENLLRRAIGDAVVLTLIATDGAITGQAENWNTLVDPVQMESVILNLALNAKEAMQGVGHLTIMLTNVMFSEDEVNNLPDVAAGQYVMLSVTDTGCGMSKEVLERAFEPFFTTKKEGEGTGLGLSMAYGFAKQSGGHIRMHSIEQLGATVALYLPRSSDDAVVLASPSMEVASGKKETILVVEDDDAVRTVVIDTLKALNYDVIHACDGNEALAILRGGKKIDLLFTDVIMPGETRATDLAWQAKEMLPAIQILFTSGYTSDAVIHDGRLDAGVALLTKPYQTDDLARRIREMLDS